MGEPGFQEERTPRMRRARGSQRRRAICAAQQRILAKLEFPSLQDTGLESVAPILSVSCLVPSGGNCWCHHLLPAC